MVYTLELVSRELLPEPFQNVDDKWTTVSEVVYAYRYR
jgi:hypothetical protein